MAYYVYDVTSSYYYVTRFARYLNVSKKKINNIRWPWTLVVQLNYTHLAIISAIARSATLEMYSQITAQLVCLITLYICSLWWSFEKPWADFPSSALIFLLIEKIVFISDPKHLKNIFLHYSIKVLRINWKKYFYHNFRMINLRFFELQWKEILQIEFVKERPLK